MNRIERFFGDYKNTIAFVSGGIVLISFWIAIDDYINNQIDERITDKDYILSLSKTLRPFSIFNHDGIIIYDHGGEEFISNIEFIHTEVENVERIILETKTYLAGAPLLIQIGTSNYTYESNRVGTYKWEYTLAAPKLFRASDSPQLFDSRFMFEILQ